MSADHVLDLIDGVLERYNPAMPDAMRWKPPEEHPTTKPHADPAILRCDLWCPTCETVVAVNMVLPPSFPDVPFTHHEHDMQVRRSTPDGTMRRTETRPAAPFAGGPADTDDPGRLAAHRYMDRVRDSGLFTDPGEPLESVEAIRRAFRACWSTPVVGPPENLVTISGCCWCGEPHRRQVVTRPCSHAVHVTVRAARDQSRNSDGSLAPMAERWPRTWTFLPPPPPGCQL